MKKFLLSIIIILFTISVNAQLIMIFGGEKHNVFLGYLNANNYNQKSIWNEYCPFGNSYNSDCIWNEYGIYGNEYSQYSPFNDQASNPPVLVDKDGNFYGYFTANEYNPKRTKLKIALYILEYYEVIRDHVDYYYKKLFES